jgi:MoaA/NifB/PqqE/SkfB family radical SAM enzyme
MVRKEISGIHYYEKRTGLHVLFDEATVLSEEAIKRGPRHLSLMVTRKCNLNCPFCYVQKSDAEASMKFLIEVCEAANELQVLDITLGGGEPTLYSAFEDFVMHAWESYDFGLSVTTNAVDISPLLRVSGMLSSVRVSIDNKVRPLDQVLQSKLREISGVHKLGVNLLCSPNSSKWLSQTIQEAAKCGVRNFLIIPEHNRGEFILGQADWTHINDVVCALQNEYEILITIDAATKISHSTLDTHDSFENLFAHIDESGNIRKTSWGPSLGKVRTKNEVILGLQQINPLRRNDNENLD